MQQNKLDAIYALVEAAEEKAVAEVSVTSESTPENRDALLDAQLRLDAKTQDAIEACHDCGRLHGPQDAHIGAGDNVISVQFGNGDETTT